MKLKNTEYIPAKPYKTQTTKKKTNETTKSKLNQLKRQQT